MLHNWCAARRCCDDDMKQSKKGQLTSLGVLGLRNGYMPSLAYTCQLNSCHFLYSSIRSYEKHLQRDHSDVLSWYSHNTEKDFNKDRETEVPVDTSFDNLQKIENNYLKPN